MKLSINLPDPEYCNGCPCCYWWEQGAFYKCNLCGKLDFKDSDEPLIDMIIRPQICKDKNGE